MGDAVFSTNNQVLIRCYKSLPAINCVQHKADKKIITEKDVIKSNFNGFGNSVGSITNRATAMLGVQSRFDKHSKEYKELAYRILCTQKYQQDELDKLKGIKATPMPKYWYDYRSCTTDYQKSICCERKPYFMIYRYDEDKKKYKEFIKQHNIQCRRQFGMDLEELLKIPIEQLTIEQSEMVKWMNRLNPVDMSECTINKICYYIEKEMRDYKNNLKQREFNWEKFKVKRRCTKEHKDGLTELVGVYMEHLSNVLTTEDYDIHSSYSFASNYFQERAKEICPNDDERRNIVLDLCYGKNSIKTCKDFCWVIISDMLLREKGLLEDE